MLAPCLVVCQHVLNSPVGCALVAGSGMRVCIFLVREYTLTYEVTIFAGTIVQTEIDAIFQSVYVRNLHFTIEVVVSTVCLCLILVAVTKILNGILGINPLVITRHADACLQRTIFIIWVSDRSCTQCVVKTEVAIIGDTVVAVGAETNLHVFTNLLIDGCMHGITVEVLCWDNSFITIV